MSKLNPTFLSFVVLIFGYQICSAQNFIVEESSVSKLPNADIYLSTAKKCLLVLEKKASSASGIQFSDKSLLTSTTINNLSDQFLRLRPQSKPEYSTAPHLSRSISSPDKQIRFNYSFLPPDKKSTKDFLQVIVLFDKVSVSPKVLDIKFKTKTDLTEISLSDREVMKAKGITPPEEKPVPVAKKTGPTKKSTAPAKKKVSSSTKK
jgi:hypothetical protein